MLTTVKTLTKPTLQRMAAAAAAAAVVAARASSPRTNERRMAKDTQAETAIRSKGNKNTYLIRKLRAPSSESWTLQDRYYGSFCIMYTVLCGAFSRDEEGPSRSLSDI